MVYEKECIVFYVTVTNGKKILGGFKFGKSNTNYEFFHYYI